MKQTIRINSKNWSKFKTLKTALGLAFAITFLSLDSFSQDFSKFEQVNFPLSDSKQALDVMLENYENFYRFAVGYSAKCGNGRSMEGRPTQLREITVGAMKSLTETTASLATAACKGDEMLFAEINWVSIKTVLVTPVSLSCKRTECFVSLNRKSGAPLFVGMGSGASKKIMEGLAKNKIDAKSLSPHVGCLRKQFINFQTADNRLVNEFSSECWLSLQPFNPGS